MNIEDARIFARQLMDQHGLQRWSLVFGQARSYFGICYTRQKRITISAPLTLLNDLDGVRNTILHEIAHALTTDRGHGRLWKAKARMVGCRPERCYPNRCSDHQRDLWAPVLLVAMRPRPIDGTEFLVGNAIRNLIRFTSWYGQRDRPL